MARLRVAGWCAFGVGIGLLAAVTARAAGPQELFAVPPVQTAVVRTVLRADTLRLDDDQVVRLIGLRAPDRPRAKPRDRDEYGFILPESSPETTLEEQAFDFVKFLLEGQTVRLEYDHQARDRDFHLLAYVYREQDDLFVNAEILRQGYAWLQTTPPNTKYAQQLRAAYQEARTARRGIHGQ